MHMNAILVAVLLLEVCLKVDTCKRPTRHHEVSSSVTIDSGSAVVTVQLEPLERPGPRDCPYSPILEWGNGNVTNCRRVRKVPIATREREHLLHFVCHNLPLNARFTLKVLARGVPTDMTPLPVYTTDVQSVTVVPGEMNARVTCNFAVGSSCQACRLKWRDINSGGSTDGEIDVSKEGSSTTTSTTISPLSPGHTYSITAADVDKGGIVSSVEVRGENFTTTAQDADVSNRVVVVSSSAAAVFLCTCILLIVFLTKWNSSRDKVSVRGISKQKRRAQDRDRNKKKWKTKKLQDGEVEDITPPLPPYTTDMFIPATVSSSSTASTESTTVDDVIVTDSVFGDDSATGTPNMAHCRTITFTATIESTNSDLAPPIPPRTNKMYVLEQQRSTCAKAVPHSPTRNCFDKEEHVAEKGSDTESMLAQNEFAKTEVDREVKCCEYPDDTISESSCDIGFPPPIPRRTQDMFCVQSFDSNDCTAVQIAVMPNPSYMGVHKATV